jgi:hypothetical protein
MQPTSVSEAARILKKAICSDEPWHVEKDGADIYVQGTAYGQWFAYTGNDAGAWRYARWIALVDPTIGRLLVNLFHAMDDDLNRDDSVYGAVEDLANAFLRKAAQ